MLAAKPAAMKHVTLAIRSAPSRTLLCLKSICPNVGLRSLLATQLKCRGTPTGFSQNVGLRGTAVHNSTLEFWSSQCCSVDASRTLTLAAPVMMQCKFLRASVQLLGFGHAFHGQPDLGVLVLGSGICAKDRSLNGLIIKDSESADDTSKVLATGPGTMALACKLASHVLRRCWPQEHFGGQKLDL